MSTKAQTFVRMKKIIAYLFVGLLSSSSIFAVAACNGEDTSDTSNSGGNGGSGSSTTGGQGGRGGDDGAGGQGGQGGGQGGQGGGTGELNCDNYCTTIMANCTADNAQYSTKEACMGACSAFEVGKDQTGNTLSCRQYHAEFASNDAALHCTHAGPGGAGLCGANCDGFCAIALAKCSAIYEDTAACMAECNAFPDDVKYSAKVSTGDSLACRLYHLTFASESEASATNHCPHIAENSTTCVVQ